MNIATPEGTRLYVFGSALSSPSPEDLDVLVVYDAARVPPETIYQAMEPAFAELRHTFGLHVHPTLLTEEEEAGARAVERFGCVDVARFSPSASKPE